MTAKTKKKVEAAIKRFINFLKYRSIGPHALTKKELKELVRSGMIKSSKAPRTAVAEAYLKTHAIQIDDEPAPRQMRDGAIDFLERMFERYSTKAGIQMEADVVSAIEGAIMPIINRKEGKAIYETLKDHDHSKYLGNELNDKVKNWSQRWKTIVTTELNRASNWGSMDAIVINNPDKEPNEILVYKQGPKDGATCDHCYKFWFLDDKKTPRVYRLSELMANGSNIGRKQRDWAPTVDSTHPNERHILHELKPGWGFSNGELEYIGKDHDQHALQEGLKKSERLEKVAPPQHAGDQTESYEPTSHQGKLVWRNKQHVRDAHEQSVSKYSKYWVHSNMKPEHHELAHAFINHVMSDPKRHLIPTSDRPTKPGDMGHSVRARHVKNLVSGKQNIRIQASPKNPNVLGIRMIRHGEGAGEAAPEGHAIVDNFAFTPGKGIKHVKREYIPKDQL